MGTIIEFPGIDKLVDRLDAAIDQGDVGAVTDSVRNALCELIRERDLALPESCYRTQADSYARRLLYRSDELGYSVVVMTWAPGQGTPVHDHCGMWCVEGVWAGQLEVTQYELREQSDDRYRFEPVTSMQAGVGSAGSLIPPHEYHTISNPGSSEPAISIHIYSGEMTECNVFEPVDDRGGNGGGDGWYTRSRRALELH